MKTYLKLAVITGLALLAGSASAQVSGKGGPVMVGADHTEIFRSAEMLAAEERSAGTALTGLRRAIIYASPRALGAAARR